jgi:hypothetical protein
LAPGEEPACRSACLHPISQKFKIGKTDGDINSTSVDFVLCGLR